MSRNIFLLAQPTKYFFTQSKDTHHENNAVFITLFARLTREHFKVNGDKIYREIESVWVDIDQVNMKQTTKKIKLLPNGIYTYAISREVFQGLVQLSATFPEELYFVTPIYVTNTFSKFD